MKLSDKACKNAKAFKKAHKLFDGGGLFLEVTPNGSKLWRLKYRFLGKEKRISLGAYPIVSLADAREGREKAKKLLVQGIDPSTAKKTRKRDAIRNAENTFKAIALEWHENQLDRWTPTHAKNVTRRMDVDIFPYIGSRPIADIDPLELLAVLRRIEARGALDVTARVKQIAGQVFRYGIATGRCQRDPSADLKGALKANKTTSYACLDIKEMPKFLDKLEKNEARLFASTRRAIKALMLTFVRTNELINASWDEFDFENATWEIPGWRMKMRNPHIVPLSRQVIDLLQAQKKENQHLNTDWVFPSNVRPKNSISNNTILFAIGRMGYKKRMTGHGFRALAMSNIKEKLRVASGTVLHHTFQRLRLRRLSLSFCEQCSVVHFFLHLVHHALFKFASKKGLSFLSRLFQKVPDVFWIRTRDGKVPGCGADNPDPPTRRKLFVQTGVFAILASCSTTELQCLLQHWPDSNRRLGD